MFKPHRNRRIAHHDFNTSRGLPSDLLPSIGFQQMDDVLESMALCLNAVNLHYGRNEEKFSKGIAPTTGSAQDLLGFIERKRWLEKQVGGFDRDEVDFEDEQGG